VTFLVQRTTDSMLLWHCSYIKTADSTLYYSSIGLLFPFYFNATDPQDYWFDVIVTWLIHRTTDSTLLWHDSSTGLIQDSSKCDTTHPYDSSKCDMTHPYDLSICDILTHEPFRFYRHILVLVLGLVWRGVLQCDASRCSDTNTISFTNHEFYYLHTTNSII